MSQRLLIRLFLIIHYLFLHTLILQQNSIHQRTLQSLQNTKKGICPLTFTSHKKEAWKTDDSLACNDNIDDPVFSL